MKRKLAGIANNTEALEQLKAQYYTREEIRAQADTLFGGDAKSMRAGDKALLEKLFVQAPAASTRTSLLKTAAVDAFFEEQQYLSEAQRRYPELLKVAAGKPAPDLKARKASESQGTDPVRSPISGGAA